jgi:K+-sensing histidine kinase KdpD
MHQYQSTAAKSAPDAVAVPDTLPAADATPEEMLHTVQRLREEVAAAQRAKREFIANISHEVRTPMNAILGFTNLLMKEELSDGQHEKLQYVQDAGMSLLSLINSMLDFSKLTAGEMRLSSAPFSPRDVIAEVMEFALAAARGKGLTVRWHVDDEVVSWVQGDRVRFRQVLLHLVNNAAKFTEHGAISIDMLLDAQDEQTATLRAVVADTGAGIPQERQDVIFDDFAQADGSSTRRFGGLGLGLSICKKLVEMMGGQIGCTSTEGQGSTFWVAVPFKKLRNAKNLAPSSRGAASPQSYRSSAAAPRNHRNFPANNTDDAMRAILQSLASEDFQQLESAAHSMHDLLLWSGSRAGADYAMRIKLAARSGDLHQAAAAVRKLETAFQDEHFDPTILISI